MVAAAVCTAGNAIGAEPWAAAAVKHREAALAAVEERVETSDARLVGPLLSLARAQQDAQEFEEAAATYQRAIDVHKSAFRKVTEDWKAPVRERIPMLCDLGHVLARTSSKDAEIHFRTAVRSAQVLRLPDADDDQRRARAGLALILTRGYRPEQRAGAYPQMLRAAETSFGTNHLQVAHVIDEWIVFHGEQGTLEEAERLARRLVSIRRSRLREGHPDIADALCRLASVHHAAGKPEAATPLVTEALSIREASLGPDHPATQRLREQLAAGAP